MRSHCKLLSIGKRWKNLLTYRIKLTDSGLNINRHENKNCGTTRLKTMPGGIAITAVVTKPKTSNRNAYSCTYTIAICACYCL